MGRISKQRLAARKQTNTNKFCHLCFFCICTPPKMSVPTYPPGRWATSIMPSYRHFCPSSFSTFHPALETSFSTVKSPRAKITLTAPSGCHPHRHFAVSAGTSTYPPCRYTMMLSRKTYTSAIAKSTTINATRTFCFFLSDLPAG